MDKKSLCAQGLGVVHGGCAQCGALGLCARVVRPCARSVGWLHAGIVHNGCAHVVHRLDPNPCAPRTAQGFTLVQDGTFRTAQGF